MKSIATACHTLSIPALFEPTSVPKSLKLFEYAETVQAKSIQYASPNQFELEAMCETIRSRPDLSCKTQSITSNILNQLKSMKEPLFLTAKHMLNDHIIRCSTISSICASKCNLSGQLYPKYHYKVGRRRLLVRW